MLKELIGKHIERNYYLSDGDNGLRIKDIWTKKIFTLHEFKSEILIVFGVDSSNRLSNLCENWYRERKSEFTNKIIEHLRPYRVKMTMVDWVVIDEQGGKMTLEALKRELSEHYDMGKIINDVLSDWLQQRQCDFNKKYFDFY